MGLHKSHYSGALMGGLSFGTGTHYSGGLI